MQEYDVITTLSLSNYSSSIFAQRKPMGKSGLKVDLRKIKHSSKHDYIEHNRSVTTIADTAQHMLGKHFL